MNIAQRFAEHKRTQQESAQQHKTRKLYELAEKITTALREPENVEALEAYLMKHGTVSLTNFGCLCEGGFCDWQKGLSKMLAPVFQEWRTKGVRVYNSLELNFVVAGAGYQRKMTLEDVKEWYSHQKQAVLA